MVSHTRSGDSITQRLFVDKKMSSVIGKKKASSRTRSADSITLFTWLKKNYSHSLKNEFFSSGN